MAKARWFAWYELDGGCILRSLKAGIMRRDQIVAPIVDEKPCGKNDRSCTHNHIELAARRAQRAGEVEALESGYSAEQRRGDRQVAEAAASGLRDGLAEAIAAGVASALAAAGVEPKAKRIKP